MAALISCGGPTSVPQRRRWRGTMRCSDVASYNCFGTPNAECLKGCVSSVTNLCTLPQEIMSPQLLVVTVKPAFSL